MFRSKQKDPNPKDDSLIREEASTYEAFQYTFAALIMFKDLLLRLGSLCLLLNCYFGVDGTAPTKLLDRGILSNTLRIVTPLVLSLQMKLNRDYVRSALMYYLFKVLV